MRAATVRRFSALVVAALLGLPATACGATPESGPPPAAPTSTAEPDALPVPRDVTASGATAIAASPDPDWVVATAGGVWVSGVGPGLQRYDATTGAVTGELSIYSVCSAMDQGFGSVWAMSCDFSSPKLVRIDATTGAATAEIPMPARLPAESSVAAGEGAVWLLTSGSPRQLLAVDPATNTVTRTLPAPDGAKAVRAGLGAVWVSVSAPGQVVRLDPASGQAVATVPVGRGASFLAVGPDAVWVINASDATVSRLDPATNAVTATIKVSSGGISGGDIAASADAVWVRVIDDALAVRIDPRSNAVVDRLGPPAGSGGVAIAESAVWITAHDRQSIWRLPG
jgi:YVTN family beta-propeller protein